MTSTKRKQESWSDDTKKASVVAGSMCKNRDFESSSILSELFLLELKTNKPK
jgi:ADP-ribosylglycohydrolase